MNLLRYSRAQAILKSLAPYLALVVSATVVSSTTIVIVLDTLSASSLTPRDVLELLYFVSGCGLFVVAILALKFAKGQVKAATDQLNQSQKIHKATVLLEIEKRWASKELVESRKKVRKLYLEMVASGQPRHRWNEIVDGKLRALREDPSKTDEYMNTMEIIFFLEYIGLMLRKHRQYLDQSDLIGLLEPLLVGYETLFRKHLEDRFAEWARMRRAHDTEPVTYESHEEGAFANVLLLFAMVDAMRHPS